MEGRVWCFEIVWRKVRGTGRCELFLLVRIRNRSGDDDGGRREKARCVCRRNLDSQRREEDDGYCSGIDTFFYLIDD